MLFQLKQSVIFNNLWDEKLFSSLQRNYEIETNIGIELAYLAWFYRLCATNQNFIYSNIALIV